MYGMPLATITVCLSIINLCTCSNIFMITMGVTKSHKLPFWEIAKEMIPKGHNFTFISAFTPDFYIPGLKEITPGGAITFLKNFSKRNLLEDRLNGIQTIPLWELGRLATEACDIIYSDKETQEFLKQKQKFDLLILDGDFPECIIGFVHHFKAPFMYINTGGFATSSFSISGHPVSYAVTPFYALTYTENMNLFQRTINTVNYVFFNTIHSIIVRYFLQPILRKHLGQDVPPIYEISRNVSFILQNGYHSITNPRPFLPNVAEIACIHCKKAKALPEDLEEFIKGSGEAGFIYFSMGSAETKIPPALKDILIRVFGSIPQRVLWKSEPLTEDNLPPNIKTQKWLPQQDILGHPKLKAFITHGGLLSVFETVYHGVPIISLPVSFDHNAISAKAELDGYTISLDLSTLTAEKLLTAIRKIIYDPKYKKNVKERQLFLKDQSEGPLKRAVYWTEYVLRHKGAHHLQSPSRHLGISQYYLLDVILVIIISLAVLYYGLKLILKLLIRYLIGESESVKRNNIKRD